MSTGFLVLPPDGSIKLEIKLTGILTTRAHVDGDDLTFARQVAPNVAGPIHQHIFCVRLDMAIDGNTNNVVEVNTEPLPSGPDNPHNTAFAARETVLASEHSAMRKTNSASSRYWRIESSEKTNRLGRPTAYRLLPSATATMFASGGFSSCSASHVRKTQSVGHANSAS